MSTNPTGTTTSLYTLGLSPTTRILTAQAIGLFGSGLITGGILSLSYFSVPALLLAPSPLAQHQWSLIYHRGKRTMPFLALLTSSAYLSLSYLLPSPIYPPVPLTSKPIVALSTAEYLLGVVTRFLRDKPRVYLLAAVATMGIVPYTMVFMRGNIDGLEKARAVLRGKEKEVGGEKGGEVVVQGGKTAKQLVDEWGVLNIGRAGLTGVGFLAGLWGVLA